MIRLTDTDKRLLTYLYHHYREPLTKIARACKISRDQVEYRLKRYSTEGIIKKYLVVPNYSLIGYKEFIIAWFKTKQNSGPIRKNLEKIKNVVSVGDTIPNYNLYTNFVCKNKEEFEKIITKFIEENKEDIIDYDIMPTSHAEFFPLKIFGNSDAESYIPINESKTIELTKGEVKLLNALEENGRTKVIDLANKTGISAELALHRLNKLYKNKIILGTRVQFDMEKLNFYFASLKLKIPRLTSQTKEKIIKLSKSHKNINALVFGISEYNCLIQLFYQTDEELRKTINEIKNKLNDEITKEDILLIENEGRARTIPF